MNPKLRSRIQRVPKDIVGNHYAYFPHTPLTQPDGLEVGTRVEVVSEPEGTGKRRIVKVCKATWGSGTGQEYTVFMHDLATYTKGK